MAPSVLIVGATRGLGASLAQKYAEAGSRVYGTARSDVQETIHPSITWLTGIDVALESAGSKIVSQLHSHKVDLVIISAGYFHLESFDEPSFEDQVLMYKTSSISPVFIVHHLVKAGTIARDAKVILVSSEAGSITLRHKTEGGGAYGHHASKAALNMIGKLLSFDLADKGIPVGLIHPGFMRTEMTRAVGFDRFWDDGGAVTPEEAAESLLTFIEQFDMSKTGQYWAPRGPGDIGTVEAALGQKKRDLSTPLQLPW